MLRTPRAVIGLSLFLILSLQGCASSKPKSQIRDPRLTENCKVATLPEGKVVAADVVETLLTQWGYVDECNKRMKILRNEP